MDTSHIALIVVDVQRDFCPGGMLAVEDGDAIVPAINELARRFECSVFTRDWHPPNHCSFSHEPRFVDGSWPPHCVAGTDGARFHPDLRVTGKSHIVSKGADPAKEAYSAFQDTDLTHWLQGKDITHVAVCGLATDYCVKETALDAVKNGFTAEVLHDLCRGVDNPKGSVDQALDSLKTAGVTIASSEKYLT